MLHLHHWRSCTYQPLYSPFSKWRQNSSRIFIGILEENWLWICLDYWFEKKIGDNLLKSNCTFKKNQILYMYNNSSKVKTCDTLCFQNVHDGRSCSSRVKTKIKLGKAEVRFEHSRHKKLVGCKIFGFFFLSFPPNKRKIN